MSDDWQVVEEAVRLGPWMDSQIDAVNALARLREREAQLEETVRNLRRGYGAGLPARVARLEEALRKIADGSWGAQAQHVRYDVCEFARRALAHEEEK